MQFNTWDTVYLNIEDDISHRLDIEDEQSISLTPRDRRIQYKNRNLTEDKMDFEEWEKSDLCIYWL